MSTSDHDFDIATALGRIEAKLDILNSTISKVMYGLLAIVAAVVGVEFLPNSPIDWVGASTYSSRFLVLAAWSFVIFRTIDLYRNGHLNKERRSLVVALGTLSFSYMLTVFFSFSPWIELLFRMVYAVAWINYGWNLSKDDK